MANLSQATEIAEEFFSQMTKPVAKVAKDLAKDLAKVASPLFLMPY